MRVVTADGVERNAFNRQRFVVEHRRQRSQAGRELAAAARVGDRRGVARFAFMFGERCHLGADQVCVQFGFLSRPGETAVCLPHKFIIEIETVAGNADDETIISS